MPRDGSGIFTKPFPDVVGGTTIDSAVHNGTVSDFTTDANTARPVVAGGTGATSATAARTSLATEVRGVAVTNYDSHVFEAGSFYSVPGATGEPVAGRYVSGICHGITINTSMVIEATVYDSTTFAIIGKYTRTKWSTWGPWVNMMGVGSAGNPVAGLEINGGNTAAAGPYLQFQKNSTPIFTMGAYSVVLATGTSNDFVMHNAGSGSVLRVDSINGQISLPGTITSSSSITGALTVAGGVGVAERLNVGGNVGVGGALGVTGNAGIGGTLHMSGDVNISKDAPVLVLNSTAGSVEDIYFEEAGSTKALIRTDNASFIIYSDAGLSTGMYITLGTSAWGALSDARLPYKKAGREVTDSLPLLDAFRLYDGPNPAGNVELFVKAQELYPMFPHLVRKGDDDVSYEPKDASDPRMWGVSYDRMGAIALAYIKQLEARLRVLEAAAEAPP